MRTKEDKSEQVRVLHILKKHKDVAKPRSWRNPTVTDTREEAMVQIQKIRGELRKVEAGGDANKLKSALEDMARVESDCASAKDGGDLNFFGRGRVSHSSCFAALSSIYYMFARHMLILLYCLFTPDAQTLRGR